MINTDDNIFEVVYKMLSNSHGPLLKEMESRLDEITKPLTEEADKWKARAEYLLGEINLPELDWEKIDEFINDN